jgi:pimeloyl-ACP methyl ester carboxylesterase
VEVVAEDFSTWLGPHESPDEDVILLGHSMGGLLSAEVVMLPPKPPGVTRAAFRHRILGTISFDVPFLGIHPGVVASGLASLFRPASSEPLPEHGASDGGSSAHSPLGAESSSSTLSLALPRLDTLFSEPEDPNFNAPFENDVNVKVRKGWRSTMHFINKHSDGLRQATKQYVKSHAEFGGAMADYRGLHARYNKIRALEDGNAVARQRALERSGESVPRVRFANYYTACTGRPKKVKEPERLAVDGAVASSTSSLELSRTPSPRISVEEVRDDGVVSVALLEPPEGEESIAQGEEDDSNDAETKDDADDAISLEPITTNTSLDSKDLELAEAISSMHISLPAWPPLSPPPMEPSEPDISIFSDKNVQTALKREHERKLKAYKQSMKDREAILADRKKVEDNMRKAVAKEALKKRKAQEKEAKKDEKERKMPSIQEAKPSGGESAAEGSISNNQTDGAATTAEQVENELEPSSLTRTTSSNLATSTSRSTTASSIEATNKKPASERHFCLLPSKNKRGERDPKWVRVFMKDMDEVQAHCGLFFVTEAYEKLVGDVGTMIEEWVRAM